MFTVGDFCNIMMLPIKLLSYSYQLLYTYLLFLTAHLISLPVEGFLLCSEGKNQPHVPLTEGVSVLPKSLLQTCASMCHYSIFSITRKHPFFPSKTFKNNDVLLSVCVTSTLNNV